MHRIRSLLRLAPEPVGSWLFAVLVLALSTIPQEGRSATALEPSLARPAWFWSSPPLFDTGDTLGIFGPPVVEVGEHCILEWFNARGVLEHDLNPTLTDSEGGDQERAVLELRILPPGRQGPILPSHWAGITQSLATSHIDVTGFAHLSLWVNDFTPVHETTRARLHIDLGRVSEDAFWNPDNVPNGKLDTEDKNGDGKLDRSEDPAVDEDTGLDGLHDVEEPGYDADFNPDPHHDDFPSPLPASYAGINNTERNGVGILNARPDTEDLNRDGFPNFQDAYFEATLDLADSSWVTIDVARDYAGNPNVEPDNGWRMFRIPLTGAAFKAVNSASWLNVQQIRLWLNGMNDTTRLQIGGVEFLDPLGRGAPRAILLEQNAPNPFHPSTAIRYEVHSEGLVRLRIYDVHGRLVRTLYEGSRGAGRYSAIWAGEDDNGRRVPSGVYWYRLDAAGASWTRKMVLTR